jgi:thiol-disulfide isomerase/thioredoxin
MRQYLSVIIALLIVAAGCKSQQPVTMPTITIQGYIPSFTGDTVHIVQANKFEKPLYWAKVVNGRFTFTINNLPLDKAPFLASLGYRNDTGRYRIFHCKNEILSSEETKYYYGAFYVDTTIILLTEDKNGPEDLTIQAGQETKALYRTQMMEFGALDNDAVKRTEQLALYRDIIKQYPRSYHLLFKLDENKALAKKAELESMLQCFEPGFLGNKAEQYFKDYLAKRVDVPVFENMKLNNAQGNDMDMIEPNAPVNMLVFWASWCSPCRKEIPELKELYKLYGPKGLAITSISIDDKNADWQNALLQEKMPWRQLIVPADKKQQINTVYEVGAVPYTIFTDAKGKLIERFIGIDSNSITRYKQLIEKAIAN